MNNYFFRIGNMGENLCYGAVRKAVATVPAMTLCGYRLSKHLAPSLSEVGIDINTSNDAEHDVAALICCHKKLVVLFGQVKTLLR